MKRGDIFHFPLDLVSNYSTTVLRYGSSDKVANGIHVVDMKGKQLFQKVEERKTIMYSRYLIRIRES